MKTLLSSVGLAFILMISLASCSNSKMEQLTKRIQYDVPISNDNPDLDWWVNNIEGSKRDPFVKRIMEAAMSGEVKAYDYFNTELTPEEVRATGIDTIYQTLRREYPPYAEYDTIVIRKTDYRDVKKIRFMEEWNWDPKSLQIDKKVIGIAPLIIHQEGNQTYNQLLFWIYLDKAYPAKL